MSAVGRVPVSAFCHFGFLRPRPRAAACTCGQGLRILFQFTVQVSDTRDNHTSTTLVPYTVCILSLAYALPRRAPLRFFTTPTSDPHAACAGPAVRSYSMPISQSVHQCADSTPPVVDPCRILAVRNLLAMLPPQLSRTARGGGAG